MNFLLILPFSEESLTRWGIITWTSAFIGPTMWIWVTRHQCIYLYEKQGTDRVGLSPSQMLGSMFLACQSALIGINIYCTPKMFRHGPRTILWGDLARWTQSLNDTVRCQPSSRTEPHPSSTLLQQAYHRSTQSLCSLVPWDGNS